MTCPHCNSHNSLHKEQYTEDIVCYQCGWRGLSDKLALGLLPGHNSGVDTTYAMTYGGVSSMQYNRSRRGK